MDGVWLGVDVATTPLITVSPYSPDYHPCSALGFTLRPRPREGDNQGRIVSPVLSCVAFQGTKAEAEGGTGRYKAGAYVAINVRSQVAK